MTQDTSKLLEASIYGLLMKLPYYGALVQCFKQVLTKEIPTCRVMFDSNGESITLQVNPDWFTGLTESQRVAVLIHEASHVDRLHLIRIPAATNNYRLGNVAADLAVNCYIDGLPPGALYPTTFDLTNFQTFEYYLDHLKEEGEEDQETGDGKPQAAVGPGHETLDQHDWDDTTLTPEQQAEVVAKTMERAIEKAGLSSDNLPAHVRETLQALKGLRVKNWHKELKKFVGKTVNSYDRERTWARRNRRYGLFEAGSKITGQKKLAIAFDTSGSMSVQELEKCLAETMAMVKQGVTGYLMQFDTQVNNVSKLKRNTPYVPIYGRGGTSFVDLMEKVDDMRVDGLVVFTDGEDFGENCPKPETPVLWVLTGPSPNLKYKWGYRTLLDK